jgi:preprotein translocase subunit YajC
MNFQDIIRNFGPLVILVVMFVIVFIVPNIREQKKRRQMIDSLKVGQKVVTIGGLFGEIVELKREYLVLKVVGTDVYLTMVRSAVKRVIAEDTPEKGQKKKGR